MPLFKFRVYWEDDDNIYRDIILKKGQTFLEFHKAIVSAFEFNVKKPASFFESNDKWDFGREISSEVLLNKKNAPALSMLKTPVTALVDKPDKKFTYVFDRNTKWTFLITLIGLEMENSKNIVYPFISKYEGISPTQTQTKGLALERLMEVEEKYDLNSEDLNEQGFSEDNDFEPTEENNIEL